MRVLRDPFELRKAGAAYEIYFVVKRWRPFYRYFNRLFCNPERRISLIVTDNHFLAPLLEP